MVINTNFIVCSYTDTALNNLYQKLWGISRVGFFLFNAFLMTSYGLLALNRKESYVAATKFIWFIDIIYERETQTAMMVHFTCPTCGVFSPLISRCLNIYQQRYRKSKPTESKPALRGCLSP